jgi:uncharacterized membrane protein YvbJ
LAGRLRVEALCLTIIINLERFFGMNQKLGALIKRRQAVTVLVVAFCLVISAATAACKKDSSPAATLQAFYQAFKGKDVEAYKKVVSKDSLQMLENRAEAMEKPLDDYIRMEMNRPSVKLPDKLETRNEKIEGDHATLELKNVEGGWNTVPFVKEDGQWKVSVDKL